MTAFVAALPDRLAEKYNSARAKSRQRMLARGFQERGHEVIVITRKAVRARPSNLLSQVAAKVFPALQAQFEEIDDGFGSFYSYDDEDENTWEGEIYVYQYSTGRSLWFNTQIKTDEATEEQEADVLWAEGEASLGPEDPGGGEEPIEVKNGGLLHLVPKALKAARMSVARSDFDESLALPSAPDTQEQCSCQLLNEGGGAMMKCMTRRVVKNSWASCTAGAVFCRKTGPLYWPCMGVICARKALEETLTVMTEFVGECVLTQQNAQATAVG